MPIKPENKVRYPADWKAIRAEVLERAGHCCERCKVPNRIRIVRGTGGDADTFMVEDGEVYCASTGESLGRCRMSDYETDGKGIDIVLTIAHLDHVPENCGEPGNRPNLQALCQRCHLTYDAAHHAETARQTRRSRMAIGDMFSGQPDITESGK